MENSIEVVFNGRGGQGVVTSAEIFARAAAYEGRNVQSVPHFGAERRGAPVIAYARISDKKIWLREPVSNPDVLTVLDQSVIRENQIIDKVKNGGTVVINSARSATEVKTKLSTDLQVFTVDATGIALKILGRPIVSTLILGALCRATGIIGLCSIRRAIQSAFPASDIELNMLAVEQTMSSTTRA